MGCLREYLSSSVVEKKKKISHVSRRYRRTAGQKWGKNIQKGGRIRNKKRGRNKVSEIR